MFSYNSKVAILIDGSFFIKRIQSLKKQKMSSTEIVNELYKCVDFHLKKTYGMKKLDEDYQEYKEHGHYRTYFYDSYPFEKKVNHPLTNKVTDYSKTNTYEERIKILNQLKKSRKFALRMGYLKYDKSWNFDSQRQKKLIKKINNKETINYNDFEENDFKINLTQKGIDIKIGMDIATIALKKLANKIVLVSGDSDFAPAAKLARVEGVDFILDPMGIKIKEELEEHIDGIVSFSTKYQEEKSY